MKTVQVSFLIFLSIIFLSSCFIVPAYCEADTLTTIKSSDKIPARSASLLNVNSFLHRPYVFGYTDCTVRPDSQLTLAEAAQMIYCAFGGESVKDNTTEDAGEIFDIDECAWYADAITYLFQHGAIDDSSIPFCSDEMVTRAAFLSIISSFFPAGDGESVFSDVSETMPYYNQIAVASKLGWISGYGDGTFRPERTISRAEAITVINRALGRNPDKAAVDRMNDAFGFQDLDKSHWAYYDIAEAVILHRGSSGYTSQEIWVFPDDEGTENRSNVFIPNSLFSTVWPVRELKVYKAPNSPEYIGIAEIGKAYCVLEETDGMFRVRIPQGEGYIDGNYCMINLPEYFGGLCAYDITNSYSSLFMIHEYEIPDLTDTAIPGYENVRLADGSFLVPLLYPTAKKLYRAVQMASADGFRLKIYDTFRPVSASEIALIRTSDILNKPVPENTFSGALPADLPDPPENGLLTYEDLMTNHIFRMDNFLAANGSMHNLGIALDLTLESISDNEELMMQTRLHDLSWYSMTYRNNENAILLEAYMKSAGFDGLVSEWWHFQDDEIRFRLGLSNYLRQGITIEGWTADEGGWRYRLSDGSFYRQTSAIIDKTQYIFDQAGYAQAVR